MNVFKKKKFEDEIKNLQEQKYDELKKEIEILQEIICKFDNNIKKCAVTITVNKEKIEKNKEKIEKLNNFKKEGELSYFG